MWKVEQVDFEYQFPPEVVNIFKTEKEAWEFFESWVDFYHGNQHFISVKEII